MITRILEKKIKENLFQKKIIILYGARQVGKTTLVKKILEKFGSEGLYLNCEILSISQNLSTPEPEKLKSFIGDYKIIVLDEAQNINNIGKILKVLHDTYPDIQIIATGSSSFDLASKTSEALTGRAIHFLLFPLSFEEIVMNENLFAGEAKLESILRFGTYPEIFQLDEKHSIDRLNELSNSYLFKDILTVEGIKKSSAIKNLLISLALQIGQEVSFQELAVKLGINRITVQKYIDILEQCFILFKLNSFSRNLRKEITKTCKIYFYDLGIRNSLIQNFNSLSFRNDTGALWENFCIIERNKSISYSRNFVNNYFWRTYDQKEVDYVEEKENKITGYEIKWGTKKVKTPKDFIDTYNADFQIIDRSNYWKFIKSQ